MKPAPAEQAAPEGTAAVVHLASADAASDLKAAAAGGSAAGTDPVARARAFAEPLLTGQRLDTGEEDRKSVV